MRSTGRAPVILLAAIFSASGARAAPEDPPPSEPAPRAGEEGVAPGSRVEGETPRQLDGGVFIVFVGDEQMGKEHFKITETADGFLVETDLRLRADESVLTSTEELKLDRTWGPVEGHSSLKTSGGEEVLVELSTVDGRLEQKTRIGDGPPSMLRAEVAEIDLYLGEASVSFAAPLCREGDMEQEQVTVFPGTDLPIKRAIWLVAPTSGGDAAPRALTLVMLDPESRDPLVALCAQERLVLVWLPAVELAAGRKGFEKMAQQLAAESAEELK